MKPTRVAADEQLTLDAMIWRLVVDAIGNAIEGGYGEFITESTNEELAEDLCECDSACETLDPAIVLQHVRAWRSGRMNPDQTELPL